MSIDTVNSASLPLDASAILPPEIHFDAVTGTFHGAATPGSAVRLTSSANQKLYTGIVDEAGQWKIEFGQTPRLYTVFHIWACDPEAGAKSEKLQFTYAGNNPKLTDVHAGRTGAFGRLNGGSEVKVYGPAGECLGGTFVFGSKGAWAVEFATPVNAGDKVFIIAKSLTGETSFPFYTEAKTFSINALTPIYFAGSGAEPEDRVQLFDGGTLLATTEATETGTWSVTFCKPLEVDASITIRRIHRNGATAENVNIPVIPETCLTPVINFVDEDGAVGGLSAPSVAVGFYLYRDGVKEFSKIAAPNNQNEWHLTAPLGFKTGDVLVAKAESIYYSQQSLFYSCAVIGSPRPYSPVITDISQTGASGTGNAGQYIVAMTEAHGIIFTTQVKNDNTWSMDWSYNVNGALPTTTLVFFVQAESLEKDVYAPTSLYATQYADPDSEKPATPVILSQDDEGTFHGTEATQGVKVQMYNHSKSDTVLTMDPPEVQDDGTWTLVPEFPPDIGDVVYATAIGDTGINNGLTSDDSLPWTVSGPTPPPPPPGVDVPVPPEIDNVIDNPVSGTTPYASNPYITLSMITSEANDPIVVGTTQANHWSWEVDVTSFFPNGDIPSGTNFLATASFEKSGSPSSGTYVKKNGTSQLPPGTVTITKVKTTSVSGLTPQKSQVILGWRGSDGQQIVYSTLPDGKVLENGQVQFDDVPYLQGMTLEEGDFLYLVSAFPGPYGSMTPYDIKPEGYDSSTPSS